LTLAQQEYTKDMRHMEFMKMMAKKDKEADMVNSPLHYNESGIECIDALQAMLGEGFEAYLQGNIAKYLWRFKYKNGVEDLKKAQWYLNKLIEVYDDKS
tara:strand:- start:183 stop:479 length:297 start_codon:yes stop_codon:yes gene_type:complete